jgi:hypothetical protein
LESDLFSVGGKMQFGIRYVFVCLLLETGLVQCAINLEGNHVVGPLIKDDPSPISDISTYHPDQHDYPLLCTDLANMHSWIPYFSTERLRRCQELMLL